MGFLQIHQPYEVREIMQFKVGCRELQNRMPRKQLLKNSKNHLTILEDSSCYTWLTLNCASFRDRCINTSKKSIWDFSSELHPWIMKENKSITSQIFPFHNYKIPRVFFKSITGRTFLTLKEVIFSFFHSKSIPSASCLNWDWLSPSISFFFLLIKLQMKETHPTILSISPTVTLHPCFSQVQLRQVPFSVSSTLS